MAATWKKRKNYSWFLIWLRLAHKGKMCGSYRMRIWRRSYLTHWKECEWTTYQLTILKEKAISYAQELEVEEFHASNGWFERGRSVISLEYIQLSKNNFSWFSDQFWKVLIKRTHDIMNKIHQSLQRYFKARVQLISFKNLLTTRCYILSVKIMTKYRKKDFWMLCIFGRLFDVLKSVHFLHAHTQMSRSNLTQSIVSVATFMFL